MTEQDDSIDNKPSKGKQKLTRLNKWMPRKRYLLMLSTRKCPIKYVQRRIYSYLVFRASKDEGATVRRISEWLGCSHHTVKNSICHLTSLNLVAKRDGRLFALEPNDNQNDWFARKSRAGDWHGTMASYREYVATPESPLTSTANAVLWLLNSFCREGVVARLPYQTIKGLAANLGVEAHAVSRGARLLEEHGLIRRWKRHEYFLEKPSEKQLLWWSDRRARMSIKHVTIFGLDSTRLKDEFRADAERINSYIAYWTERMMDAKMPADEVFDYWQTNLIGANLKLDDLMALFCYTDLFKSAFSECEAKHKVSGKYSAHCLNLLRSVTPRIISEAKAWNRE